MLYGCKGVESLSQLYINIVANNLEGDVRKSFRLSGGSFHDFRMPMPGIGNSDTRAKIDITSTFDVPDFCVFSSINKRTGPSGHTTRHSGGSARQPLFIRITFEVTSRGDYTFFRSLFDNVQCKTLLDDWLRGFPMRAPDIDGIAGYHCLIY